MTDSELVVALETLGVDAFCPQMMALWPFVELAWNDDRVDAGRRRELIALVRSRRRLGHSGMRTFQGWLGFSPSDKFLAQGHAAATALIRRKDPRALAHPSDIVTFCRDIASQASTVFGGEPLDVPAPVLGEVAALLYVDASAPWTDVSDQVGQTVLMKSPLADLDVDYDNMDIPESLTGKALMSYPPMDVDAPAVLILKNSVGKRAFPVLAEGIRIGRGPDNDIVLTTDIRVSRHHCRIELRDGAYLLVDNDSANGTHVNGQFVVECELKGGERIAIGDSEFQFQLRAAV